MSPEPTGDAGRRPTRATWRRRWGASSFVPPWPANRPELQQAVADEWFAPGSRLLDIGCGDGGVSLHLAQLGFDVLGVDYAEAAVRRAERRAAGAPGARFAVLDVCRDDLGEAVFAALLDVGCFQSLAPRRLAAYARNVARAAAPGARFLLLATVFRPGIDAHDPLARALLLKERVESSLSRDFLLERVTMPDPALAADGDPLRLAVRLVRRAA